MARRKKKARFEDLKVSFFLLTKPQITLKQAEKKAEQVMRQEEFRSKNK